MRGYGSILWRGDRHLIIILKLRISLTVVPHFLFLPFLPPLLHILSLSISLTPPDSKTDKSRGDRLAPLGTSQPEAERKGSSPDTAPLCSETASRGDIYMKGTGPSHPGLKEGKKGLYSRKQSKDNKRLR